MRRLAISHVVVFLAVLLIAGCAGVGGKPVPTRGEQAALELAQPRQLFHERRYDEALVKCNDLARRDPLMPGLAELRKQIVDALTAEKARVAGMRSDSEFARAAVDVAEQKHIPETYGLRLPIQGEKGLTLTTPTPIEETLILPVSLYFTNLPLSALVAEIGAAANINIIVDSSLDNSPAATKTLSIHAEKVPLKEIFDYVSRNMGVAFFAGQNVVWVTAQPAGAPSVPMETRVYKLMKGLANLTMGKGTAGVDDDSNITKAINMFVPPEPATGSALFLDKNTHVLIVKDTRERLIQIEKIIETLDVTPPQILIEARFMSTAVTDLRELGVDWSMADPVPVTTKRVLRNGEVVSLPHTQIAAGAPVSFNDFENSGQGLNLTYQGILTAPRFEAVLHALEKAEKTRTLSVPRITTANNFPANIHVGENFLYWTSFQPVTRTVYDANNNPRSQDTVVPNGNPTEKPLGITLDVTPTVGADMKTVTLRLNPRIDSFVRYEEQVVSVGDTTLQNQTTTNSTALLRLPIFREQSMDTKVSVQSGETVVLGGLITTVDTVKDDKIPILGSLPIVGGLFRHRATDQVNQNLLVFVTATIISQRGESLIPVESR